ncbi:MAG: hypothetical protein K2X08_03950 [Chlamydiales bacterium]|nr:hypothetical protein [Chlamydiales bacterium]
MSTLLFPVISYFLEPVQILRQEFHEIKEHALEGFISINQRYGFSREQWLEITRIALRALAPLEATFLTLALLPPLIAHITLPFIVLSVSFLSAFYGLPDPAPVIGELEFEFED